MKKMLVAAMFTLFAVISGSAQGTVVPVDAHAASASSSTGEPGAFDPVCTPAYVACTADCQDLNGGALGACLRVCRAEYEECLAN
jgi:hypothetical protein